MPDPLGAAFAVAVVLFVGWLLLKRFVPRERK